MTFTTACPACESRNAKPRKGPWGQELASCPDCGWEGDESDLLDDVETES